MPRGQLTAPDDVVGLANDFKWNYGQKSVKVQPTHQGILGQWLGLRTEVDNPWMAILEDDLALSPCFYSYLLRGLLTASHPTPPALAPSDPPSPSRPCHRPSPPLPQCPPFPTTPIAPATFLNQSHLIRTCRSPWHPHRCAARHVYGMREDIAGFTLQKHGPCLTESQFCAPRDVEGESSYLVRCVGTWGFMPNPRSWAEFTEWQRAHNGTSPVADLPGQLVHHKWYAEFIRSGKLDSFWSVWHLAYTHAVGKATLVAELPQPLSLPHGQQR